MIYHYEQWVETTTNPFHKSYAKNMLQAAKEDRLAEKFSEYAAKGVALQRISNGEIFESVRAAAKAYNVTESTMSINYLRYGLQKVKN